MANYAVKITSISTSTNFCTITTTAGSTSATYTDYNGNTGTLASFSWTGTFTITTTAASSLFDAGEYKFSGGLSSGNGYNGHVKVPGQKRQDKSKDWTATEG